MSPGLPRASLRRARRGGSTMLGGLVGMRPRLPGLRAPRPVVLPQAPMKTR